MMHFGRKTALLGAGLFLVANGASAAQGALGGGLSQLVQRWENSDPNLSQVLALHLTNRSGDPLVKLHVVDGVTPSQVLPELSALGFRLTATSSIDHRLIEGFLPLSAARAAASVPGVEAIRSQFKPHANAGLVQSQAVALQKADLAQARGITGAGIKVAALSDSFDACARCRTHAAQDVASGDLSPVTVLQEDFDPGTDEGRAMLQLVHDVAPGAQLGFASAFNGEVQFAENIKDLRTVFGADVVVDDVIYFDEPMFSDGIVAQAADFVHDSGGAYFSSSMNNGIEAFEADFQAVSFAKAQALEASGQTNLKLEQIPANLRPLSFHNFGSRFSPAISQLFTTAGDNIIDFQWDEPFNLHKVKTDFNILIFDKDGNWLDPNTAPTVFYTTDDNIATDQAIELAEVIPFPGEIHGGANASDYQFVVCKMNDGPANHFKHVVINGLAPLVGEGASSTWGHAAASGAIGVAAMFYAIPNFPEDFSSPGPTTIFFDKAGNRLHHPDVRFKPEVTAGDGVNNTFFRGDTEGDGFPNFFGTSAAAPDAAATAALVLQAAGGPGSLRTDKLYKALQKTATPVPLPNDRTWSAAFSGPVAFTANGDWVRWNRYFGLTALPLTSHSIASVALDVSTADMPMTFSLNPNRFHVGPANGVSRADMTFTISPDQKVMTINFAPGTFSGGDSFRFGMSVFHPLEGTTQIDPDRFRGTRIITTLDNGQTFTGTVFAAPRERINNFTGFGLVNADAATRSVARDGDDD